MKATVAKGFCALYSKQHVILQNFTSTGLSDTELELGM